jgi:hypothetical protein
VVKPRVGAFGSFKYRRRSEVVFTGIDWLSRGHAVEYSFVRPTESPVSNLNIHSIVRAQNVMGLELDNTVRPDYLPVCSPWKHGSTNRRAFKITGSDFNDASQTTGALS